MKNIIFLFLSTLTLSCCNKDENNNSSDTLPLATTKGANTAGCLVNGELLLPKGTGLGGPILSCFYQQDGDEYSFGLSFSNKTDGITKSVNVSTNIVSLVEGNSYVLTEMVLDANFDFVSNFAEYTIYNAPILPKKFITNNINVGELTITKLDTQQKIISGVFWYDAKQDNGEVIQIRDGRFDMHYIN